MLQVSEMFSAKVPRYTSYPTAPHFHSGIDAAVYRDWLRNLPENVPLSLYVHIPFCDTLCWFCGCHTTAVNSYKPVADYCDLLQKEVELVSEALKTRRAVSHIHWGGGSPTLLHIGDIARLGADLRRHFDVLPKRSRAGRRRWILPFGSVQTAFRFSVTPMCPNSRSIRR